MKTVNDGIEKFDFGKAAKDYAKYRDIYPKEFYDIFVENKIGVDGQRVLDIGTGSGVIPRFMAKYNATWIGTDISFEQIEMAKNLSKGLDNLSYMVASDACLDFPDNYFDSITICQCIWYLNGRTLQEKLLRMLKPNGKIIITYMAWLPGEDKIAYMSENLILKYNDKWSGYGELRKPVYVPSELYDSFKTIKKDTFDTYIPFTIDSWAGRMRACRGAGGMMDKATLELYDKEHKEKLKEMTSDNFNILHFISYEILMKK